MITAHSLDELSHQNAWGTIGIFDGVHRGHQEILRRLVAGAHAEGCPAAVLTFESHPAVVLGGKANFKYLTTLQERIALLESSGVDVVIVHKFDRALAQQSAEEFMRYLMRTLGLRHLVLGYDSALGRNREAGAARLTEIGQALGYTLEVVPPLKDEMGVISSTRIRAAVLSGDVTMAASHLGRCFFVTGPVIHGDGRGRSIGIPTANIQVPEGRLIPANGIYATWAWVNGQKHPAATSLGIRPTFTPAESLSHVEAYLLDFNQDLYGQEVKLEFVEYLRPEKEFSSVQALLDQIARDVEKTREVLGK